MNAKIQMNSCRRMTCVGRVFLSLGFLPVVFSSAMSDADAQESRRAVDLRHQPVPILRETVEASNFKTLVQGEAGVDDSLPLNIVVQSIAPVSKTNPKAVVEIVLENVSKRKFSIPISRENKILHYDGNEDRRIFTCSVRLTPPANAGIAFGGMIAYSSSNEPSSRVELRPGESLQLTFEANMERLWVGDTASYHDAILSGAILGAVVCSQEILTPHPNSTREQRQYLGRVSEGLRSRNAVRLIIR